MKLDNRTSEYLDGKNLSNGAEFVIDKSALWSRNDLLQELALDKKVLHYGCADHVALILSKRAAGTYLHDLLHAKAETLVGVDLNVEALNEMKKLDIDNLYHPDDLPHVKFDIVMIPDVIEHVSDVGTFLSNLRKIDAKHFVFTTPNAYRIRNRLSFRTELINTDHKYWFSPYTLSKCLNDSGFLIKEIFYTDSLSKKQPIRNIIKINYPLSRDGLLAIASPK
jgi:hypothetical protein